MTTAQNRSPLRSTATMSVGGEQAGTEPIVFAADTEPFDIENPSIVDDLRPQNVFPWSEQHARQFRKKAHRTRRGYSTLTRIGDASRIVQSAVFGFGIPASDRPRGP